MIGHNANREDFVKTIGGVDYYFQDFLSRRRRQRQAVNRGGCHEINGPVLEDVRKMGMKRFFHDGIVSGATSF
jgi:hypothetical protein